MDDFLARLCDRILLDPTLPPDTFMIVNPICGCGHGIAAHGTRRCEHCLTCNRSAAQMVTMIRNIGNAWEPITMDPIARIKVELDKDERIAQGEDEREHNERHWPDRVLRVSAFHRELLEWLQYVNEYAADKDLWDFKRPNEIITKFAQALDGKP